MGGGGGVKDQERCSHDTSVMNSHDGSGWVMTGQLWPCTDKKENQIFLIYKEIQSGAVAKSYMTNGLLIYGEIFAHFLIY